MSSQRQYGKLPSFFHRNRLEKINGNYFSEVVKNLEDLFATRPSTRTSFLFPHLQALQDQLALLRKQDDENRSEEPAGASFAGPQIKNKAEYLASFLEFLNAEWQPSSVFVYSFRLVEIIISLVTESKNSKGFFQSDRLPLTCFGLFSNLE